MQQQQKNRVNYSVSKEVYEMEIYIGWVILDVAGKKVNDYIHSFPLFFRKKNKTKQESGERFPTKNKQNSNRYCNKEHTTMSAVEHTALIICLS